jgi:hypothetical protein
MIKKFTRNPWLLFSPFLLYYGYLIVINKWPTLYGDEIRYVDFAKNLLHGFYSPPAPHINLWNGPGYPILLMPFVALHIPDLYTTLMNAVYLYLTVVFLYQSISLFADKKIATVLCLLLAIYPNALSVLPILYTEAFTGLLVSSFIYSISLFYIRGNTKYSVIAGLVLGYLILTKIIFGYVIVVCLVACLLLLLIKKNKNSYLKSTRILLLAFAVSIPYLIYTWHVTGKVFYWGDSGGMSLYWMSTPFDHEYGDWKLPDLTNHQYPISFKSAEVVAILKKNHSKDLSHILKYNEFYQDVLFKQIAISNIESHPVKFACNYYYNISRMLFNFPYSYSYQDGAIVKNILIGSLILWASVIGIVLTIINRRSIVFPVWFALSVTGVYLLLSGALSSYPRQLDVMMPVILFWIGYLAGNLKKINLKFFAAVKTEDIDLIALAETETAFK